MQALGELSGKALGCLLVVGADGKLMGTFTDGDLRRTLQSRGAQVPACQHCFSDALAGLT